VFGGRYVAETLMPALIEVERAYREAKADPAFRAELETILRDYVGRPSPLYLARRLTGAFGGAKVYLKREDLNHTGAHKINNTIGQGLLARRMGKQRLMAEPAPASMGGHRHRGGAVRHGVRRLHGRRGHRPAGAERQADATARRAGHPVSSGTRTLKDAMSEALRAWVTEVETTFYVIGTVAGPHPYPVMVRDFQSVIGVETKGQIREQAGRLPDMILACVGGGSTPPASSTLSWTTPA